MLLATLSRRKTQHSWRHCCLFATEDEPRWRPVDPVPVAGRESDGTSAQASPMALPPSATLDRARALHQAGELEEAESLCRAIPGAGAGAPGGLESSRPRRLRPRAAGVRGRADWARHRRAARLRDLPHESRQPARDRGGARKVRSWLTWRQLGSSPRPRTPTSNVGLMRLKLSRPAGGRDEPQTGARADPQRCCGAFQSRPRAAGPGSGGMRRVPPTRPRWSYDPAGPPR